MNRKKILALALAAAAAFGCAMPVSALGSAETSALQSLGVLQGSNYSSTTATRGEFARMLVAVSGRLDSVSASSTTSPFSDVPYQNEYAGYIRTVAQEGTMSGYLDGSFRPYEGIKLEEAAVSALKLLGYTPGSGTVSPVPTDNSGETETIEVNGTVQETPAEQTGQEPLPSEENSGSEPEETSASPVIRS